MPGSSIPPDFPSTRLWPGSSRTSAIAWLPTSMPTRDEIDPRGGTAREDRLARARRHGPDRTRCVADPRRGSVAAGPDLVPDRPVFGGHAAVVHRRPAV